MRGATLVAAVTLAAVAVLVAVMLTFCSLAPSAAPTPPAITEVPAVETPTAPGETAAAKPSENSAETKPEAVSDEFAPDNEFTAAAENWKKRLSSDFEFAVCKPFLVISDVPDGGVQHYTKYTVKGSAESYYKMYFAKKPKKVLTVFLFKNDTTYRKWAKDLFGDTNISPYGYYTPSHSSLVMNIATGGGTLVHEMFHALVEPDFPDIPAWANEGIASLYEQSRNTDGRLVGLVNWRLPGLKKGMLENRYVPLRKVFSMNRDDFYAGYGGGMHYAESRYFCMWLQEHNLLEKFYHEFRERQSEDATGIKFLEELLGKKLEEAETGWKIWAATLSEDE